MRYRSINYKPFIPKKIVFVKNIQTLSKVILPIIRRVMPNIIANSIIGVSPMSGPVGQIHTLRYRYNFDAVSYKKSRPRVSISKDTYSIFTRLNNRKKTQLIDDIKNADYPFAEYVAKTYDIHMEVIEWCNETYGTNGYITYHKEFFFENKDDYVFFIMRWIE